jgi:type II secretory pathway pseudopilin PulG
VTISTRVREESGFGLVELLVAMTIMVVAITALVAGLSSGFLAVNRAAKASTAAAVADIQMEGYRKVRFTAIPLTCVAPTPPATDCFTTNMVTGPDGRSYQVDHEIRWNCAAGTLDITVSPPICTPTPTGAAARPAKRVTIVVKDPSTSPPKELFRETSTFDQATG